jgi:hypothetical protein
MTNMEYMELLKAMVDEMEREIRAGQEHLKKDMEVDREGMKAEIGAGQEQMASLVSHIEANQAKTDVNLKETREETKSDQAEMRSSVSAIKEKMEAAIHSLRARRIETMAYQEKTGARLECKEPIPENTEAEQEKVPKEQGAVKPVRGLRKRHRGRNLATERRQTPEDGSQRKLVLPAEGRPALQKWHNAWNTSLSDKARKRLHRQSIKDGRSGRDNESNSNVTKEYRKET